MIFLLDFNKINTRKGIRLGFQWCVILTHTVEEKKQDQLDSVRTESMTLRYMLYLLFVLFI